MKRDCRIFKKQKMGKGNAANLVEKVDAIVAMVSHMYIGMITELNIAAATKFSDWWC